MKISYLSLVWQQWIQDNIARGCTVDSNQLDLLTLHGGTPVVAGEKWIATKWMRQRRYG